MRLVLSCDVLIGAWEVDCDLVVVVTCLLLRRVLAPPLLPLWHLPSYYLLVFQ